jgi:hypothetical protein
VLRRIFGPKRDEIVGGWRKLHNQELCNLYTSPNVLVIRMIKSRRTKWPRYVADIREKRNMYRTLVENPEEKRLLGLPNCRWEDYIRMGLRETG